MADVPEPQRLHHQVPVLFTVEAESRSEASQELFTRLREYLDPATGAAIEARDARVLSWVGDEALLPREWESFLGSPIPEMVVEMFPPEPLRSAFERPDGSVDLDAHEDAHDRWRDECLSLAVQAARLPDLLRRLGQAERFRDGVLDAVERHPLPTGPAGWEEFQEAARARDVALRTVMAQGGRRTAYLPAQFHQEWLPADLLAISTLRALLAEHLRLTERLLGREDRQRLEAMLFAADPEVHVPDPDDAFAMPIYEGPASEAHRWIVPGVYPATGLDGTGEFRLVVGRVGATGTASAAFPPAEHDSTILNQIARALEDAADAGPEDVDLREVLDRIDTLVGSTGRAVGGGTLIERGALLSELLAEREQRLHPDDGTGQPPERPEGPDLTR